MYILPSRLYMYQLNWVSSLLLFLYWKKIDVIFVKLFGFFFSWQITCCISGNWYGMSNDCHIYWWEFNYLKSRIFKEWSHLIFSKRLFLKISKPCWKYYVNCLLMTKDGFDSQLTHVSLCLTMALCTILYLNDGWVHRLS